MDFNIGQTVGDYSITAVLSAGVAESVYQVQHRLTKRKEAMKVLAAELATEIEIKRFEREMRALGRLNHPNIAVLYNAIYSENRLILFMEMVEGQTLESVFGEGQVPLPAGIEYVKQILSALDYAHRQGVVHRDVTPANVIVTPSGEVKLTDFGLSKSVGDSLLTNCGEVLGSLPYLAPEQLKGVTQPDPRSDLYSAGAILYEHLTGHKPFGENRKLAAAITDSEGPPQRPSQVTPALSPQWDAILLRALAAEPARRYQSASEFLEAIAQLGRPTRGGFQLPRISASGIGYAVIGGLILALAAFPAIQQFRPVVESAPQVRPMRIAPPDFAFALTPAMEEPPVKSVPARRKKNVILAPASSVATSFIAPPQISMPFPPVMQPIGMEAPALAVPPDTAQPKKNFWSKVNIFRKRKSAEQQ
jgi:serine/threonine-protein kinase